MRTGTPRAEGQGCAPKKADGGRVTDQGRPSKKAKQALTLQKAAAASPVQHGYWEGVVPVQHEAESTFRARRPSTSSNVNARRPDAPAKMVHATFAGQAATVRASGHKRRRRCVSQCDSRATVRESTLDPAEDTGNEDSASGMSDDEGEADVDFFAPLSPLRVTDLSDVLLPDPEGGEQGDAASVCSCLSGVSDFDLEAALDDQPSVV